MCIISEKLKQRVLCIIPIHPIEDEIRGCVSIEVPHFDPSNTLYACVHNQPPTPNNDNNNNNNGIQQLRLFVGSCILIFLNYLCSSGEL
jgi:hypothetical protein